MPTTSARSRGHESIVLVAARQSQHPRLQVQGLQGGAAVLHRVYAYKGQHVQADLVPVDLGPVAPYVARLLQRPHAPPAGGCGQADALGQFDIGYPAFGLQFGKQPRSIASSVAMVLVASRSDRQIKSRGAILHRSPPLVAFGKIRLLECAFSIILFSLIAIVPHCNAINTALCER